MESVYIVISYVIWNLLYIYLNQFQHALCNIIFFIKLYGSIFLG